MGQAQARAQDFGLRYASQPVREKAKIGEGVWQRLGAAILAKLQSDTAPLGAALAYSHAYRALPVPRG